MRERDAGSRGCFCPHKQLTRTRFWRVATHRKTGAHSADERLYSVQPTGLQLPHGGVGGQNVDVGPGLPLDMTLSNVSGTNAICGPPERSRLR